MSDTLQDEIRDAVRAYFAKYAEDPNAITKPANEGFELLWKALNRSGDIALD